MTRTLINYLILMIGALAGCTGSNPDWMDSSNFDLGIVRYDQDLSYPETSWSYNDCRRAENKNRGFCKADWMKCSEEPWCEIRKYRDYISIKSSKNPIDSCECTVKFGYSNYNAIRMFYGYDIASDDVEVKFVDRYSGTEQSLRANAEMHYTDVFKIDPFASPEFTVRIVSENCTGRECQRPSELRIYYLKVSSSLRYGGGMGKIIYEASPLD